MLSNKELALASLARAVSSASLDAGSLELRCFTCNIQRTLVGFKRDAEHPSRIVVQLA